jgi:uncharacterized protein (DUF305 family)
MPGMATPEEIDLLSEAPSNEADRLFLRLMIPHHQGAIPMAEAILERTERSEVRQLAEAIKTSQQGEIALMEDMLRERVATLPRSNSSPRAAHTSGGASPSPRPGADSGLN